MVLSALPPPPPASQLRREISKSQGDNIDVDDVTFGRKKRKTKKKSTKAYSKSKEDIRGGDDVAELGAEQNVRKKEAEQENVVIYDEVSSSVAAVGVPSAFSDSSPANTGSIRSATAVVMTADTGTGDASGTIEPPELFSSRKRY